MVGINIPEMSISGKGDPGGPHAIREGAESESNGLKSNRPAVLDRGAFGNFD